MRRSLDVEFREERGTLHSPFLGWLGGRGMELQKPGAW